MRNVYNTKSNKKNLFKMKSYIKKINEEIKQLKKENEELQRKNGEWALIAVESNFELDLLKADYEALKIFINNFINNKTLGNHI